MSHKIERSSAAIERSAAAIQPGDLLIFVDQRTSAPSDASGGNQIGVAVSGGRVLFCRKREVVRAQIADVESHLVKGLRPNIDVQPYALVRYFEGCVRHYRLFLAGLRALRDGNHRFFGSDVMPNAVNYSGEAAFDSAWRDFESQASPGDLVAVFDRRSMISKIIASIDRGAWSHVAVCTGVGVIDEALTSGLTRRPLNSYCDRRFHVGLYRHHQQIPDLASALAYSERQLGKPYNFSGALMLGMRTLLHLPSEIPTPNGLIYSGRFYLVEHV